MSSLRAFKGQCKRFTEKKPVQEFEGTVIDIETIGNFSDCDGFGRYKQIRPITAGFLDSDKIDVLYVTEETEEAFDRLKLAVQAKLCRVDRPFYAFNVDFEIGVLYWFLGRQVSSMGFAH